MIESHIKLFMAGRKQYCISRRWETVDLYDRTLVLRVKRSHIEGRECLGEKTGRYKDGEPKEKPVPLTVALC